MPVLPGLDHIKQFTGQTWRWLVRFLRLEGFYQKLLETRVVVIRFLRTTLGWMCIVAGLILLPLPIPLGIVLLVIGTLLVGTRTRILRVAFVSIKLFLRRWARSKIPLVGSIGQKLLRVQRQLSNQFRKQRRHTTRQT
jgi:hypothetical protein